MMKVSELCPHRALACRRETTLAGALALFREHGVDALPVVDALGRVLGVLSEREIAAALAVGPAAARLRADDVMDREVATCHPSDDVRHVLPLMALLSAARLPVVDDRDRLWGMLQIEDVLCGAAAGADLPARDVVAAFYQATRRRRPAAVPRTRRKLPSLGRSA
jgi:CBS domain-containing protein